ncbi:GGDEF domain-containing protein [Vibrio sp. DW001]|uniref:GGDEF domain-containing protein n=1 Tax=Vibrio sp. DW001 TaxID=2912315 RepID=UPI0023AF6533|nr:GGDEF domain-containing protein [Vibrio sp. DW001]WED25628.1 GGDEF domain-containing protein [Vibrio sp. DW001]
MTKQDFHKAAETLRAAVPLMIKNQTPTTPQNYELWYTYIEQTQPQLNSELDGIIAEYGLCLPSHNRELYQTYCAGKTESDIRKLKGNLESLVNEVSLSMRDTLADTTSFEKSIEENFSDLDKIEKGANSFEDLLSLVRDFAKNSEKVKNTTSYFNEQMSTASTEISNLKEELERVQNDALYDSLSGLLNRGAFDKALSAYCISEHSHPLCLILLDIDNFKRLNDDYGHVFGDLTIKAIAQRLQASCRDGFAAYRYGGEEFALLMPSTPLNVASQFAEIVRKSIEKISVKNKRTGKQIGNISASFGVAQFAKGETSISIIDRADQQLYEAKRLGKNKVMPIFMG